MYKLSVFCLVVLSLVIGNYSMITEAQKAMIQGRLLSGGVSCLNEHPLSLSDIKSLRRKVIPNGENAKCFVECLFKKIGIMDNMGKITSEGTRQEASKIFNNNEDTLKKVDQFINSCSSVNNEDFSAAKMKSCDRSKMLFSCLVENAPKFGFDMDF